MRTTYALNRRGGHCPGHIRDTFLAALDAYHAWDEGEPEPRVDHERDHHAHSIPISQAARLVWNCTDILPHDARATLELCGLDQGMRRWTFASAARAMAKAIRSG